MSGGTEAECGSARLRARDILVADLIPTIEGDLDTLHQQLDEVSDHFVKRNPLQTHTFLPIIRRLLLEEELLIGHIKMLMAGAHGTERSDDSAPMSSRRGPRRDCGLSALKKLIKLELGYLEKKKRVGSRLVSYANDKSRFWLADEAEFLPEVQVLLLMSNQIRAIEKRLEEELAVLDRDAVEVRAIVLGNYERWTDKDLLLVDAVDAIYREALVHGASQLQRVQEMIKASLIGGATDFKSRLQELLKSVSQHNLMPPGVNAHREFPYQLWLLALLQDRCTTHFPTVERESAHGRYDVMLAPRQVGGAGAVFELKVVTKRDKADAAAESAISQAIQKDYAYVLREEKKANPIWLYGIVFYRKEVVALGVKKLDS